MQKVWKFLPLVCPQAYDGGLSGCTWWKTHLFSQSEEQNLQSIELLFQVSLDNSVC